MSFYNLISLPVLPTFILWSNSCILVTLWPVIPLFIYMIPHHVSLSNLGYEMVGLILSKKL